MLLVCFGFFGGIEVYIGGGCAGEPATGKGIVRSGRF